MPDRPRHANAALRLAEFSMRRCAAIFAVSTLRLACAGTQQSQLLPHGR